MAAQAQHSPVSGHSVPSYYPMLDRAIARILQAPIPANCPTVLRTVMRGAVMNLSGGGLSRRAAETHVMRYLMCEAEVRHG